MTHRVTFGYSEPVAKPRKDTQPLVVEPAPEGWARATWHDLEVDVRFEPDGVFSLRVVELRLREPWARRYREVPLSRIEHAVNANGFVKHELFQHLNSPLGGSLDQFFEFKAAVKRGMSPRYKLERPGTRRLDDEFYAAVARAYADAVAWGLNPRKTLALDSDIPADTVARWIRTARGKGYLSQAEPGKASGVLTEESESNG